MCLNLARKAKTYFVMFIVPSIFNLEARSEWLEHVNREGRKGWMEDAVVKFLREMWGYKKREVEKWLVEEGVGIEDRATNPVSHF